MRMSDDHDELRAMTRYGFPGAIAASALMFTLDGVPLIYNGMEVGDSTQSGDPALFEPQKIFWGAVKWHPEYPKFYEVMTALRHDHPALQQGATIWLHNTDEQHVVTYLRRCGQRRVSDRREPVEYAISRKRGSRRELEGNRTSSLET